MMTGFLVKSGSEREIEVKHGNKFTFLQPILLLDRELTHHSEGTEIGHWPTTCILIGFMLLSS